MKKEKNWVYEIGKALHACNPEVEYSRKDELLHIDLLVYLVIYQKPCL